MGICGYMAVLRGCSSSRRQETTSESYVGRTFLSVQSE